MATILDVEWYRLSISTILAEYGTKLAKQHQYGHKPSFDKEIKFMLLQAFVEMANWYLDEWNQPDTNGITIDQFNDIQQHINRIANTTLWLELDD